MRRLGWRRRRAGRGRGSERGPSWRVATNSESRFGVEAKPRPRATSEPNSSELSLVLVDPASVAAEELGYGVGVEELLGVLGVRSVEVLGERSGEALKEVVIEEFCVELSESVEAVPPRR